ncbi:MAG TPA: polysaccharide biosynthesis tyrosine autokinase [Burkholderiaceae bacterium]|nr:polysaccharide biosynthesis tyrosine autokinase [Burkholderiaceae bacterium]
MNDLSKPGDTGPATQAKAGTLDIVEYWNAIAKRRWSILALTILVAILATLIVQSIRPSYRGTATLLIEQGKTKVVSIEEIYNQGMTSREYFQTQVEILKSDDLARKTVEKLKLTTHPDFDPRQAQPGLFSRVTTLFSEPKPLTEEDILKIVVAKFKGGVQIQLVRNSQLAQISFTAYDKELSAKVPNAMAEIFIESDLEARMAMTQKASEWLRDRLGELRTKVDASEKALQDYRDRERIVDTKGLALSGAGRQLEELTKGLVEARAKRADAEAAYSQVQQIRSGKSQASYEMVPAVLRHPLVQKLKEVEGDAERKLGDAAKRYGPEHPKMIQAKAELEAARENTRRQIEVVVQGIAKEYEVAKANEASVERALGQSKADIQGINRKEFQLGILEREVSQNRHLYDMFVGRLKETSVGGDLQTTIARLVDPATVPAGPIAPKKAQIVGVTAALALVVAAMLALLLDRLNNTINSTGDVESRLGVPALGVLQKVKGFTRKGFLSELAFFNDSQSTFAEAVRTVRTSVLMSALDEAHKVVLVTSSVPEEGKTTVAFNLACALGQVKKVLLVDGDLRRPKIARLVGRKGSLPGLADFVAGQAQASECVFFEERAGIHILPAGTVPPNPLDLLSSHRFQEVLAKLKEGFDIVIIDSAPLQLVSDALVLSQFASSLVYVVKADSTPYQVAQNGLKKLRRVNAPILGVVLNQLDLERAEKYYGEYSGYKSYKGYKKYGYSKTYGAG